jgi:hypothetical protein
MLPHASRIVIEGGLITENDCYGGCYERATREAR